MPKTVLVVDDDAATRNALTRLLRRIGYAADAAGDGESALAYLSARGARLVILDHMMPEMDGLEVLRQMRRMPALNGTPVVIFSAVSDPTFQNHALGKGASDYWVKASFNFNDLGRRIQALVGPPEDGADDSPPA